ncbi:hypothetical protein RM545_12275 [Zunongwangia sp. F260]|uniref:Histone H1 n=1 Tax=Autumnicola lenta TaxID=3075593 RepID=A0ABU3CM98_9FLAO|nr:hypothetical protein [Zunongwangia sp. F260]MDT0647469.1 hypothetical protein [Zunongwangia sp. F260]
MSDQELIKQLEKLEAFAQATIDTATAVRKGLEERGGDLSPTRKGKAKDAAMAVLKNRRVHINSKKS